MREAGYDEGETLTIEYRWADNRIERLPELAADLVRRRVATLAAIGNAATLAAKAATATIPIVFQVGEDPVKLGPVVQPRPPGRQSHRYQLLRQRSLREADPTCGASWRRERFVSPSLSTRAIPNAQTVLGDMEAAAPAVGMQIEVRKVATIAEIEATFAALARQRPDALFGAPDPILPQSSNSSWSCRRRGTASRRPIPSATTPKRAG